jgi:hypothetical protein
MNDGRWAAAAAALGGGACRNMDRGTRQSNMTSSTQARAGGCGLQYK